MSKILSIIVPSYNMEAYLPKCLGSLIIDDKELLQKLDVIVVNDGSKDRTSEIAHEFEAKYPGVFRVIDKANGHYGSCVNRGLAEAKGVFVKILDADDTFETESFKSYLNLLVGLCTAEGEGGEVDLIVSDFQTVDVYGSPTAPLRSFPYPSGEAFGIDAIARNDRLWFQMHALAYRTERLREMNYKQIEGVMYSDTEWTIVPLFAVRKVRYFPVRLYLYLMGREGQSMAAAVWDKGFHDRVKVVLDIAKSIAKQVEHVCPANRELVDLFVFEGIKNIYTTFFLKCGVDEINSSLRKFDADLKAVDANAYARIRKVTFPIRWGFHLIRFWQDHKWSDGFAGMYLKVYSCLVRIALWFLRK